MSDNAFRLVFDSFHKGIKPDAKMDLYEYSNTYRYLSSKGANEYGRYNMDRIPCLIDISPVHHY